MSRKKTGGRMARPKQKSKSVDAPMRFKILQAKPSAQHYRIISAPSGPLASVKGWLARQKVR